MADSVELPGSAVAEPEFASEMEITVQSDPIHKSVLRAYGHNTVEDVLVKILGDNRAGRAPEPRLFFNDMELQKQKTLADCGIKPDSVLHLKCTPRMLAQADDPTGLANMGGADSNSSVRPNGDGKMKVIVQSYTGRNYALEFGNGGFNARKATAAADGVSYTETAKMDSPDSVSSVRPNGDGEMKIFVQSKYSGTYAIEVDSSNTIQDVLITFLHIERSRLYLEPRLYFNGHPLEGAKSLADYGIKEGSILHLEATNAVSYAQSLHAVPAYCSYETERPNVIPERKKITITDRPLAIWEKERDKILLSLLVEQISNGGGENILHGGEDSWCNIVAKFNESTGLQYEHKHLSERFNFYRREYHIVNRIRHHPKFSWDHQCHVVIATDADWNEYIKGNRNAWPYRRRAIPYVDLLEVLFANTKV